jgi:hypothetical protein
MKRLVFLNVLLSCGLFITSSFVSAAGWSGETTILEIYPSPDNNGVLIKSASMPNPDKCPSPTYFILNRGNMFFDEIYSLLMSAQARKSTINLYLNDCMGANNVHPQIYQVIAK